MTPLEDLREQAAKLKGRVRDYQEAAKRAAPQERAALAGQMQQLLLEDGAFVFCSHLQMSLIAQADVAGLAAHPSDFYEITAALAPVS